jgi:hypothetical protein
VAQNKQQHAALASISEEQAVAETGGRALYDPLGPNGPYSQGLGPRSLTRARSHYLTWPWSLTLSQYRSLSLARSRSLSRARSMSRA